MKRIKIFKLCFANPSWIRVCSSISCCVYKAKDEDIVDEILLIPKWRAYSF